MSFYSPLRYHFKKMPIAVVNEDPPTVNQWYTILPATRNVRLLYIATRQIHDEALNEDVVLRITIDGITMATGHSHVNNTWYYWHLDPRDDVSPLNNTQVFNAAYYTDMRGHSVMVEVRQTTAVGTNAQLDGRVQYEVLEARPLEEGPPPFMYRKQAIATVDEDPPTVNTWYTILDLDDSYNSRILFIAIRRLDDDANAKAVNVRVTIDGVVVTRPGSLAQNDSTWHYWYMRAEGDELTGGTGVLNAAYYTDLRGRRVTVEVRQTAAPGANAELDGRVQYETLEVSRWNP